MVGSAVATGTVVNLSGADVVRHRTDPCAGHDRRTGVVRPTIPAAPGSTVNGTSTCQDAAALGAVFGDLGNQLVTSGCMLEAVDRISNCIMARLFAKKCNGEVGDMAVEGKPT